ncbi:MAG TPA: hypothetical protein VNF73_04535 [Candidatus Saccharimonadales bacterium]|nr:hypothetical protein [Candidatus Saccharimonadales bacterium]HVC34670.1 hypothetical protein [Chloroflexota bacterium]
MPRHSHRRMLQPSHAVAGIAGIVRRFLYRWRHRIPIEVLTADRAKRAAVGRELDRGLRRLRRVLGDALPGDLGIVAQHVIATDHQLAGCYQIGQRPDGNRFALIRLALQVNGRRLAIDELLAVLAEQCIGLAAQGNGPTVLVPIDLEPGSPPEPHRLTALPADPLGSSLDGTARRGSEPPTKRGA